MSWAHLCDRRLHGRREACGTRMADRVDQLGRVVWSCHRCAWQLAGRCWECGEPRQNRSVRCSVCDACRTMRRQRASRRHEQDPQRRQQRRVRDRRRQKTAARKAWREAWVAANPDRIKRYKRREALNPQPVCRVCQASIPFIPPGRPKTRCDACVPPSVLAKRRPALVEVAA